MRILFIVRGLHLGGAERQLALLARGLRRAGHDVAIAVGYAGGVFEDELRGDDIRLHDLRKRGRWDNVRAIERLEGVVRGNRPEVVHGYMELGNLYASAMKLAFPSVTAVWGIRTAMHGDPSGSLLGFASGLALRAASTAADLVVANSDAARRRTVESGVDPRKIVVVPNGVDCHRFRPDRSGGAALRSAWRFPADAKVVGIVARLDPVKDHRTFLRAAAILAAARADVRFAVVGDGAPAYRALLQRLATELGLGSRLVWEGARTASRAVYAAFDLTILSSDEGESFPNVVAESMACGTPCVVTDSGDAAAIVADTGAAVAPRDPAALATAAADLLDRAAGDHLAARARGRVEQMYSVDLLVQRTADALGAAHARVAVRHARGAPGAARQLPWGH